MLKKHSVVAVHDDYLHWKENDYDSRFGKLLMIDQADYNTQHIFFDDNADEGEQCIVDVRDLITGEQLPREQFLDMYVVKVQPHRAIVEGDYFIKAIEVAESKRDEEIRKVEAGIADVYAPVVHTDKNAPTETEWEKLQTLADGDYLMKTVLPVLYQGMRVVEMERPNAPLEYLALYLLKNQGQIKLPAKTFSEKKPEVEAEAVQEPEVTAP